MLFSVCTATFNRAHTLHRVYESLLAQTERDFEWLVIDDGSVDNTAQLVASWKKTAPFHIRYEYQPNKGKHIAINKGATLARGEFFLIADSDDSFLPTALASFCEAWNGIPKRQRSEFTGVTGLCVTDGGEIVGDKFPIDVLDTTSLEVFYRHNIGGEKWGFHRTDVIREFPSPSIPGIPFYGESIIWHKIARKYKTRFINVPVRIYRQDAGNQLTGRTPKETAPARIFYVISLNEDHDYMSVAPMRFLKVAVQGVRLSLHHSDTLALQFSRLKHFKLRVLWLFSLVPGYSLFLVDNFRSRKG